MSEEQKLEEFITGFPIIERNIKNLDKRINNILQQAMEATSIQIEAAFKYKGKELTVGAKKRLLRSYILEVRDTLNSFNPAFEHEISEMIELFTDSF